MNSTLPLFVNFDNFFRIGLIIFVALVLRIGVAIFLGGFVRSMAVNANRSRVRTLTTLVSTICSSIIWILAFIIVLKEIGFDITPIVASAGVIGIAVAFGAQTMVKDLLSGFFLLIEDQFREGEEIEVAGKKGIVEKGTLRAVTLREKSGAMTTIPYSSITVLTNYSRK